MGNPDTGPSEFVATPASPPVPASQSISAGQAPPAPGFLDVVYGVVFRPVATYRTLTQYQPMIPRSLLIVALSSLVQGTSMWLQFAGEFESVSLAGMISIMGAVGITVGVATNFFSAAVMHLFAELFGGRGTGMMLFSLIGMCQVPGLLLGVAALIPEPTLAGLATGGLGLWTGILTILAIRESERLSTGRALAVFFMPIVALTVAVVLFVVFVASFIFSQIPGLESFMPV